MKMWSNESKSCNLDRQLILDIEFNGRLSLTTDSEIKWGWLVVKHLWRNWQFLVIYPGKLVR
jgi:hypothetical protein